MDRKVDQSITRDKATLLKAVDQIQTLADNERNALGFWPEQQLKDAIQRGRLWAALDGDQLRGYVIYSGVYPHAKVQAIAATEEARKQGVASCLLRSLTSELERLGYLTIKAEVAEDLAAALKFYQGNGFKASHEKAGGKSRNRNIIVHVRELDSPSLLAALDSSPNVVDLGIRRRSAGDSPLYAFDLNVYLDLAREREQSDQARELFGAALAHSIRLAVASEFVVELQRSSGNAPSGDPVLNLALRLPKIPAVDTQALQELSAKVYEIVFGAPKEKGGFEPKKLSDAKHLAHAALARASAFVTRDGALLSARNELLARIGIDTIDLQELVELLPVSTEGSLRQTPKVGTGFEVSEPQFSQAINFLGSVGVQSKLIDSFFQSNPNDETLYSKAIFRSNAVVALGALVLPSVMQPVAQMLVCVSPDDTDCELFADHLIDALTRHACANAPIAIELANIPGQTTVHSLALARGFVRNSPTSPLHKVALGQPLTETTWPDWTKRIHRQTGLELPQSAPSDLSASVILNNRDGVQFSIQARELENILSPALVVVGGQEGALVPIRRTFADALLGTSKQSNFPFIEEKAAAFVRHRSYVNSPRTASVMLPERPILFYESLPQGGRGAVVAVARILDTVVLQKGDIPNERLRRLVVDDVEEFSSTEEVLLTTFDNLFELPRPVPLSELRNLGAIDGSNLVSATAINNRIVSQILDWGWSNV